MNSPTRYKAVWVSSHEDEEHCYSDSMHQTFKQAEAAAIRNGRKAGVIEWAQVCEQRRHPDGYWQEVARWTGDWDALEQSY